MPAGLLLRVARPHTPYRGGILLRYKGSESRDGLWLHVRFVLACLALARRCCRSSRQHSDSVSAVIERDMFMFATTRVTPCLLI